MWASSLEPRSRFVTTDLWWAELLFSIRHQFHHTVHFKRTDYDGCVSQQAARDIYSRRFTTPTPRTSEHSKWFQRLWRRTVYSHLPTICYTSDAVIAVRVKPGVANWINIYWKVNCVLEFTKTAWGFTLISCVIGA